MQSLFQPFLLQLFAMNPGSSLRGCWVKESCRQCELNAELESVEARFTVAVKVVGEADKDGSKHWYKD